MGDGGKRGRKRKVFLDGEGRFQINIRCSEGFVRRIEEYLRSSEGGVFSSKSEFIRHAVIAYLEGFNGLGRGVLPAKEGRNVRCNDVISEGNTKGLEAEAAGVDTSMVDDSFLEEFG